jgi:Methylase of polypeptide chain release factors
MFQTTISHYAKVASNRYRLLSEWNPFENELTSWFDPEWMFGTQKFDIIIANPPYIHLEHIKELSAFYKTLKYSTYEARGDIYALFYEKGVQMLKENGFLCYITSNKWMRAAYGKSLRSFFANTTNPIQLIDFAGQQIFEATVDTNILLLSRSENQKATSAVTIKDENSISNMSDYIKQNSVTIPFITSDSWTILSPIEQSIKAKIDAVGTPLKDWDVKINRGILTGCNDAFIISEEKRNEILGNCGTSEEYKRTAEIIRPILRGRDIKRYGYEFADLYLIVSHNGYYDNGGNEILPLDINNYPAIKAHLDDYWDIISVRTDKGVTPYNLRNCAYMDDFSKQKIVWAETMRIHRDDVSNFPRFSFCTEPIFTDKTCFIAIAKKHPLFILGFMNSAIGRYSLKRNVSILDDGGYLLQKVFLENVVLPVADESPMQEIESLVIKSLEYENLDIRKKIDSIFYQLLSFSEEEIRFIEEDNEKLLARR